jgi:hypothetical protein
MSGRFLTMTNLFYHDKCQDAIFTIIKSGCLFNHMSGRFLTMSNLFYHDKCQDTIFTIIKSGCLFNHMSGRFLTMSNLFHHDICQDTIFTIIKSKCLFTMWQDAFWPWYTFLTMTYVRIFLPYKVRKPFYPYDKTLFGHDIIF